MPFKFSIVIPIKYESDEIYSTLQTLISQPSNIEVIVSDASGSRRLSAYIAKLNDDRFFYYERASNLSFSEDWEQSLLLATGTYVTVLGDDDGFIAESINNLNQLSKVYDVIMWQKANYHWPNHIKKERQNTLSIKSASFSLNLSAKRLRLLSRNFFIGYARLPSIYNSFVHIDLIKKARKNSKNGLFFGGVIPDVYSSVSITYYCSSILYLGYPLTINGASSRSSGVIQGKAQLSARDKVRVKDAFNAYKSYPAPANIYSQSVNSIFLGEYLLFSENILTGSIAKPNLRRYLNKLYDESSTYDRPESILNTAHLTSLFLGIKPKPIKEASRSLANINISSHELSTLTLPQQIISDVYNTSKLLCSLVPNNSPSPLSRRYYIKIIISQAIGSLKQKLYLLFCLDSTK